MSELISNAAASRFTVFAVRKSHPQVLLQLDVPWERLMEDIVTPFESGELFFIDGAPIRATDLDRMKILVNRPNFGPTFARLHWEMRTTSDAKKKEIMARNYPMLLEALTRENCTDVTSQVISAFKTAVKPKLSDHLPDKKALFDAAIKLVIEGTKAWAS